jgi:hypothetical protein
MALGRLPRFCGARGVVDSTVPARARTPQSRAGVPEPFPPFNFYLRFSKTMRTAFEVITEVRIIQLVL